MESLLLVFTPAMARRIAKALSFEEMESLLLVFMP
jgi:hypothetical protein